MRLLEALHHCDLSTFDWCLRRKHRALFTQIARKISATADGHLYVISALILLVLSGYSWVSVLALAFLIERPVYMVLKTGCKRNRPPQAIPGFQSVVQPSDKFSFPSGHTSAAFLFATAGQIMLPGLGWLLYPWAITVGMSRVLLGVHFPTDTVAGALLGTSVALLSLHVLG